MPSLSGIEQSYGLVLWLCLLMLALARLIAAGLEAGSRWGTGWWGIRRRVLHLVDPTPAALARNQRILRSRILQAGIVLVLIVPAAAWRDLGGHADTTFTGIAVLFAAALSGMYVLWRLHRLEVEGLERNKARIAAEGYERQRGIDA